jgi:hypothetical protein
MNNPTTLGDIRKFIERRVWIAIALMVFALFCMVGNMAVMRAQIVDLQISEREFNLELREQVQMEVHVMTWNQFYDVKQRLKLLEEAMWLEGYEHTKFESMTAMNNRLLLKDFNYMLMNTVAIHDLDMQINFPYVTQQGIDAPYVNDCGSAAVLMVAKFYDVAGTETVLWTHNNIVGEDAPTNYVHLVEYLEEHYELSTDVIVTHAAIKEDLVEQGFAGAEEITVIDPEDFPDHMPVIWIYSVTPHWIVRYNGWAYDSLLGIRRFEATENIYRPDFGLGIIVYEE